MGGYLVDAQDYGDSVKGFLLKRHPEGNNDGYKTPENPSDM